MKRIDTKGLKNLMHNNAKNTHIKLSENSDVEIIVQHTISVEEMAAFVDTVVSQAFKGDTYISVNEQVAYDRAILAYYTNLPYDCNNEIYSYIVYETDILNRIKNEISSYQLNDIRMMIAKEIDFKNKTILSHHKVRLDETIERINREQDEVLLNCQNLIKTISDAFGSMDFDIDKLERILDKAKNINSDEVAVKVVSQVGDSAID